MKRILIKKFLLVILLVLCVLSFIGYSQACTLSVITQDFDFQIPSGFNIPSAPIGGYTHDPDCPRNDMKVTCNANWVNITPSGFDIGPGETERLTVNYNTKLLPPGTFEASCTIHGETTEPLVEEYANFSLEISQSDSKSFFFNCEKPLDRLQIYDLEKLDMTLGNSESCTVTLINVEPGKQVEVLTKTTDGIAETIDVFPVNGFTDENGQVEFEITPMKRGVDWLCFAVKDDDGQFKFNREAYNKGLAWCMFVFVK